MKKLLIWNFGAIAVLSFLFYTGYLSFLLAVPTVYVVSALLGLTALAVASLMLQQVRLSKWISKHMTRFGMLGTGIGLVVGMQSMNFTSTDTLAMANEFAHHIAFAFLSTILGIAGNIWINWNLHLVKEDE
jgi:flagellar motor component MotA